MTIAFVDFDDVVRNSTLSGFRTLSTPSMVIKGLISRWFLEKDLAGLNGTSYSILLSFKCLVQSEVPSSQLRTRLAYHP